MNAPQVYRRFQHGFILFAAFVVFPGWLACCQGVGPPRSIASTPSPPFEFRMQAAPPGSGLQVGPEAAVASADGSSSTGVGVRCNCETETANVSVGLSATKYFPDAGSSYGAWLGARYARPTDGAAKLYGLAGPVLSRSGYSVDEYEIPTGELGGGAFQQGFGGGSQNALGLRVGAGLEFLRAGSAWAPYGELGYDAFLVGADFGNQLHFAAGVTYRLGTRDD